ncbi:MAG: RagB/SusD family nutrient uptake outer membrane protein [Bacteroidetes bacterium]|nr:RagB/SusD family nutrient uptake outer membrane protein [Bacteroidota bacterium]
MTRTTYTLILAGVVLAGSACKKSFVTRYPEGQVNEGNFFKTTADFEEALTGVYGPLRDAANVAFYMEEMRSDNTHYDYNAKDRGGATSEQLADFLDNSANPTIENLWKADYMGIQRADVLLDKMEAPPSDMADSVKNRITGEAKALRAHYYFELVRLYGQVPLYLHAVTGPADALVNRSPVDAVYAQIQADLNDAVGKLPPPSFPQAGGVTKGMAATELGLVYLTLHQYDKAIPLFQSVTQMGYSLLPNYADVFDPGKKITNESIFEVQYKSGTDNQQSQFIYDFIPVTPNTTNILGQNFNNTAGGWNTPTDDIISVYEKGDKRLDISVGVVKGKLDNNSDFQPDGVISILSADSVSDGIELYKRFVKKQFHLPLKSAVAFNTDDDWPVYRYSDLLLMLAEALNENGQTGAALPYLNQVRLRAGLAASAAADQGTMRDAIAHERRVELAFENKRWFDLLRTGKAIEVMTAYGVKQKQRFSYLLPQSYNVTENKLIYAIPSREVQLNPALGQNPGY